VSIYAVARLTNTVPERLTPVAFTARVDLHFAQARMLVPLPIRRPDPPQLYPTISTPTEIGVPSDARWRCEHHA
jgi:hypothetical protein